jgi:hypothetical protein
LDRCLSKIIIMGLQSLPVMRKCRNLEKGIQIDINAAIADMSTNSYRKKLDKRCADISKRFQMSFDSRLVRKTVSRLRICSEEI